MGSDLRAKVGWLMSERLRRMGVRSRREVRNCENREKVSVLSCPKTRAETELDLHLHASGTSRLQSSLTEKTGSFSSLLEMKVFKSLVLHIHCLRM